MFYFLPPSLSPSASLSLSLFRPIRTEHKRLFSNDAWIERSAFILNKPTNQPFLQAVRSRVPSTSCGTARTRPLSARRTLSSISRGQTRQWALSPASTALWLALGAGSSCSRSTRVRDWSALLLAAAAAAARHPGYLSFSLPAYLPAYLSIYLST